MRAITYDSFGPARDVLKLEDIPTPSPGPGEVLVRLHASGVNPSDTRARSGGRPGVTKPPFPKIIPHSDGAGVIEAVGDGVPTRRIGEKVWVWNGQWQRAFGTAAEYIALPEENAVPLGDSVPFEHGAILGIPGLTAHHTVLGDGPIADQIVLISGGAGTVGHIAIQVAAASGARVLATARGADGIAAASQAGAEAVFDYSTSGLAEQILDHTGGAPVDRIVEVEFGMNAETNARIIAERGTIASYGSAKDMTPTLPFYPLMFKAVTIRLALIYMMSPSERSAATLGLSSLVNEQALTFRISEVHDLEDCAAAHETIEAGHRSGSVLPRI